jgi:CRISPR-associated exonuclease Cas4
MSGFILLALAAVALIAWVYFRGREQAGALPQGTLTYSDTDGQRLHETLVSHRYGLVGRPDYVIQTPEDATPVEVKSRSCGTRGPYPEEKAQLFAYCLLIEDVMGARVRQGVIQFADRKWPVAFGEAERREILGILSEMQNLQGASDVRRSHGHAGKCRACGFRAPGVCGQALP